MTVMAGEGARWALLKNPTDLTDDQAGTLRKLERCGGDLWRAYALKETLRAIFAGDLSTGDVDMQLGRFCSKASRGALKPLSPPPGPSANAATASWLRFDSALYAGGCGRPVDTA